MSDTHSRYVARPYWYDGHKLDPSDLDLKAYVEEKVAEALAASQPGGGSGYLVKSDLVTLDNAQILALPTTPIQIVAAPGENKFISLVQGVIILDNVAGAYGNITGGATTYIAFAVGNQISSNLYIESDMGDMEFPGDSPYPIVFSTPANIGTGVFAAAGPSDAESVDNMPLYIKAQNTGNFTGGHADNTLKVTVYYLVVDL